MVAPVCATTAAGPDPARRIRVRCRVVSTSTTRGRLEGVPANASGDQPCARPSARTRYRCRHAQLTTATTSSGVRGAHVHTPSTSIARAQFSNRCRDTATSRGNPRGAPAATAPAHDGTPDTESHATAPLASAAPAATKRRRESRAPITPPLLMHRCARASAPAVCSPEASDVPARGDHRRVPCSRRKSSRCSSLGCAC